MSKLTAAIAILILVPICHTQQTNHFLKLRSVSEQMQAPPITMRSHFKEDFGTEPWDSNQFSSWILAYGSKIPENSCPYPPSSNVVVKVNMETSYLLGNRVPGFECKAWTNTVTRSVTFFGSKHESIITRPFPVTNETCLSMIRTKTDPSGTPLKKLTWNTWETTKWPDVDYYWPSTDTGTVTNYKVKFLNLTIQLEDNLVAAPTVEFTEPCHVNKQQCNTSAEGIVVWHSHLTFGGAPPECIKRHYPQLNCLLSQENLRCPEARFIISTLKKEIACGQTGSFVRIVVSNRQGQRAMTNTSDFVPLSLEFSQLYNETIHAGQQDRILVVKQFLICPYALT